jgi:hypothetical protein
VDQSQTRRKSEFQETSKTMSDRVNWAGSDMGEDGAVPIGGNKVVKECGSIVPV